MFRLQAAAVAPAGCKGRRQNEAPLSKTVGDDVRRLISKSGKREGGKRKQSKPSSPRLLRQPELGRRNSTPRRQDAEPLFKSSVPPRPHLFLNSQGRGGTLPYQ